MKKESIASGWLHGLGRFSERAIFHTINPKRRSSQNDGTRAFHEHFAKYVFIPRNPVSDHLPHCQLSTWEPGFSCLLPPPATLRVTRLNNRSLAFQLGTE